VATTGNCDGRSTSASLLNWAIKSWMTLKTKSRTELV